MCSCVCITNSVHLYGVYIFRGACTDEVFDRTYYHRQVYATKHPPGAIVVKVNARGRANLYPRSSLMLGSGYKPREASPSYTQGLWQHKYKQTVESNQVQRIAQSIVPVCSNSDAKYIFSFNFLFVRVVFLRLLLLILSSP